jgi:hypothetical protein
MNAQRHRSTLSSVEQAAGTKPWAEVDEDTKKTKKSRAKRRLREEVVGRLTLAGLKERAAVEEIQEWLKAISGLLK